MLHIGDWKVASFLCIFCYFFPAFIIEMEVLLTTIWGWEVGREGDGMYNYRAEIEYIGNDRYDVICNNHSL